MGIMGIPMDLLTVVILQTLIHLISETVVPQDNECPTEEAKGSLGHMHIRLYYYKKTRILYNLIQKVYST